MLMLKSELSLVRYLTDSSLKAIAENSISLCALNLVNISNLTDIGIGHLANGILKFKILKLCRNAFRYLFVDLIINFKLV